MQLERLRVSDTDGVARIVLTHPPVNALDGRTIAELVAVLEDPAWRGMARVVVLSGAGRCFSAGHDRSEDDVLGDAAAAAERFAQAQRCVDALTGLPIPVVAAVHGAAIGFGLILAASCTAAVFSDDTRLQLPERLVGMAAGMTHARRLLPPAVARWMVLSGRAVEAAELRGALPVVAAADLAGVVDDVATELARCDRALVAELVVQLRQPDVTAGYAAELAASVALLGPPPPPEER